MQNTDPFSTNFSGFLQKILRICGIAKKTPGQKAAGAFGGFNADNRDGAAQRIIIILRALSNLPFSGIFWLFRPEPSSL